MQRRVRSLLVCRWCVGYCLARVCVILISLFCLFCLSVFCELNDFNDLIQIRIMTGTRLEHEWNLSGPRLDLDWSKPKSNRATFQGEESGVFESAEGCLCIPSIRTVRVKPDAHGGHPIDGGRKLQLARVAAERDQLHAYQTRVQGNRVPSRMQIRGPRAEPPEGFACLHLHAPSATETACTTPCVIRRELISSITVVERFLKSPATALMTLAGLFFWVSRQRMHKTRAACKQSCKPRLLCQGYPYAVT